MLLAPICLQAPTLSGPGIFHTTSGHILISGLHPGCVHIDFTSKEPKPDCFENARANLRNVATVLEVRPG